MLEAEVDSPAMKKKAKTGRPPLPADEKRSNRVVVHLTHEERKHLIAFAELLEVDIGAAARTLVVECLKRERRQK